MCGGRAHPIPEQCRLEIFNNDTCRDPFPKYGHICGFLGSEGRTYLLGEHYSIKTGISGVLFSSSYSKPNRNCAPGQGLLFSQRPRGLVVPSRGIPEEPGRPPTLLDSKFMELESPPQSGLRKPRPLASMPAWATLILETSWTMMLGILCFGSSRAKTFAPRAHSLGESPAWPRPSPPGRALAHSPPPQDHFRQPIKNDGLEGELEQTKECCD